MDGKFEAEDLCDPLEIREGEKEMQSCNKKGHGIWRSRGRSEYLKLAYLLPWLESKPEYLKLGGDPTYSHKLNDGFGGRGW